MSQDLCRLPAQNFKAKSFNCLRRSAQNFKRIAFPAPLYYFDTLLGQYVTEVAAPKLGVELTPIVVDSPVTEATLRAAFAKIAIQRFDGALIPGASEIAAFRPLMANLTNGYRLPSISTDREFPDSGGLMSYGVDQADLYVGCAGYVARILKGEKPAGLPIQLPKVFEFVVNMKAAKEMGIDLPYTLTSFANEIIE